MHASEQAAGEQADRDPGVVWPILLVYGILFPIAFLLYFPFYLLKLQKRGGWRDGFGERFACFSPEKLAAVARMRQPIWLHAVSVGETQVALRFIHDWQAAHPERQFVLSTTTSTGQALARKAANDNLVPIYCPLDWSPVVMRALRLLRPAMVIIFEVEIWPALISHAFRQRIPLALVNCRLSDRSADGFSRHSQIFRPLFRRFSVIAAQSEADAARVARVTGDPTAAVVCSTMKYDQVADPGILDGAALDAVLPPVDNRVLIVGASTHAGEEIALAQAFCELRKSRPNLQMVIVPRHAERAPEILAALAPLEAEFRALTDLRAAGERAAAIVGDTTGELLAIAAAADVVYVGKSLGDLHGGQNPIEPALLGKVVIHGPNMENFRQVMADFRARRATVQIQDAADLTDILARLVDDPAERQALGARAKAVVDANRGAIARTIQLLEPQLHNH